VPAANTPDRLVDVGRGAQMTLAGAGGVLQYGQSMLTRRSRSARSSTRAGVARGASRSFLSLVGLGVPLFVLAQALTSCGSDDDSGGACKAGELKACAVAGNSCEGVQTCTSDGSGYSPCACPGDTGNAGGTGGSASVGGSGGGSSGGAAGSGAVDDAIYPAETRAIGTPCATDADCPVGPGGETPLTCITSTSTTGFESGGPQGGYCSLICQGTPQCSDVDPLSACGLINETTGNGVCVSLCQPGAGQVKCDPDRAQACISITQDDSVGGCFPMCQSDAACGAGQFCDLGRGVFGVCTATPLTGGDVGAPCTAATEGVDCKSGICLTLTDDVSGDPIGSFCSAGCTFGLRAGCGFDDANTPPRDAFCLQPSDPAGDLGDLGVCFEMCDTDADCTQAGWQCLALTAAGQTFVGRVGECLPPGLGDVPDSG
jgi:hypothetical protein